MLFYMEGISKQQRFSDQSKTIALIGNYLPRHCGITTFTSDLLQALAAESPDKGYWTIVMNDIRKGYDYPTQIRFEVYQNKLQEYHLAYDFLNMNRVELVCLLHEFDIFGGTDGSYILALLQNLRMPVVTTLHTILYNSGLQCLDWLLHIQTDNSGHFVPIGNRGWYKRNGKRMRLDQQPVDAGSMVEACVEAYFASGENRWAQEAIRYFEWFLGRNDFQTPVYDYTTGGCRDKMVSVPLQLAQV
jgi:hypothetical protein